jgi:RNA polymerase sigma factor (sigma-70 family)
MTETKAGTPERIARLVAEAKSGREAALEELVRLVQGRVYGLALRMLWHPEDARDAAQEILLRVITRIGSFRGEAAFTTWVYRIAANYLLDARSGPLERMKISFDAFAADLDEGLADAPLAEARGGVEAGVLLEEVKLGCTLGMLACLDRPHRLAYILGEILGLADREGAQVLAISGAAFRKRLSRARKSILDFMRAKCGLVSDAARCHCGKRVDRAIELKRVDPRRLLFAQGSGAARFAEVEAEVGRMESARRSAALFRSQPGWERDFVARIRELLAVRKRAPVTLRGVPPSKKNGTLTEEP